MQNRDDYLKTIGIQQWQRRGQTTEAEPTWHMQGPENALFAFAWQQQNHVALDWGSSAELQLLQKIMQAVGADPEQALLLWPLAEELSAAPHLPQACCCVVFGNALTPYIKHTKTIQTLSLNELSNNAQAKRSLWQALKQVHHD